VNTLTTEIKPKTKTELAKEGRRENALAKVKAERSAITKLEGQIESAKSRLVKHAHTAKKNGATLAEIAEIAGKSIGWVQQALVSVGYVPRDYKSNGKQAAK
jgi:hypothetical protein